VLPAILAGGVITFLEAIASFGTPALIGLPARYSVVSTQLWAFFSFPIKLQAACAYSMPLVILTILLFWFQRWMTRRRSYVVQTGKSTPLKQIDLGAYRWVLFGFYLAVFFVLVVLPYFTLISASVSKAWGLGPTWDNLTLSNFALVIERPTIKTAILNTFSYALAAAVFAVSLGTLIAYGASRKLIPFGQFFSVVCLTPFVIPGMVLAIGFYAAYAPPPLSLYGTSLIIIFAFTTRFLPIAFASVSAAIRTINPDMEDQVRNLGGDRVVALKSVVLPMLKHSLLGAGILVFIPALGELSTALFLSVEDTKTLSVTIFHLNEGGNRSAFELLSALGVLLFVSTTFLVACGMKLLGNNFIFRTQSP
jgi:iron(III) transport system permease protein